MDWGGHIKEFGLYPKINKEALKDFKQNGDMLRHAFGEDSSGCCVKNGLDVGQRGCRGGDQLGGSVSSLQEG